MKAVVPALVMRRPYDEIHPAAGARKRKITWGEVSLVVSSSRNLDRCVSNFAGQGVDPRIGGHCDMPPVPLRQLS